MSTNNNEPEFLAIEPGTDMQDALAILRAAGLEAGGITVTGREHETIGIYGISLVGTGGWEIRRTETGFVVAEFVEVWPLCDEGDTTDWDDPAVAYYPTAASAAEALVVFEADHIDQLEAA